MILDFRQVIIPVIPDFRQVRISVTVPSCPVLSRKLGMPRAVGRVESQNVTNRVMLNSTSRKRREAISVYFHTCVCTHCSPKSHNNSKCTRYCEHLKVMWWCPRHSELQPVATMEGAVWMNSATDSEAY